MTVLVLSLGGPLQAWGSSSRFTTRGTDAAPTKSGILGLLAAAKGLRRSDPLEDLLTLHMAVRIDQPGVVLRDFQTARSLDGRQTMPLSYRFYRADARYLVGLNGEESLLQGLRDALERPTFPLYLGRRSCPPSEPLVPQLVDVGLASLIRDHPWIASDRWRKTHPEPRSLAFHVDDGVELEGLVTNQRQLLRDVPLSFDPAHRQYSWRSVLMGWVPLPGAEAPSDLSDPEHDPMRVVM